MVSADERSTLFFREVKGTAAEHDWACLVRALDSAAVDECVDCGARLGGLIGSFGWGIVHGLGECGSCGFPYQYYHRYSTNAPGPTQDVLLLAFVPAAEVPLRE